MKMNLIQNLKVSEILFFCNVYVCFLGGFKFFFAGRYMREEYAKRNRDRKLLLCVSGIILVLSLAGMISAVSMYVKCGQNHMGKRRIDKE